ncbi:hypothetical protein Nepgr_030471 [Nepenthes gracilis]|uniref:Uncharacterized protein n=1 Tax=Nepenthes gracilis TaxID=150966 RepID=A0AAD3TGI8_NEPGR|nr:hypothetical protein Nepgr_030471 [Nepenthes gracilis]
MLGINSQASMGNEIASSSNYFSLVSGLLVTQDERLMSSSDAEEHIMVNGPAMRRNRISVSRRRKPVPEGVSLSFADDRSKPSPPFLAVATVSSQFRVSDNNGRQP